MFSHSLNIIVFELGYKSTVKYKTNNMIINNI